MTTESTSGLVPRTVDGWSIFGDGTADWIRDVDLAERADLVVPRDIRRTIAAALKEGSICMVGAAHDAASPRPPEVRVEQEIVPTSNKGHKKAAVYYLSEEAALVIVTRLRTPKAIALTRAIVRVFLLAAKGALPPEVTPAEHLEALVVNCIRRGKYGHAVAFLNAFRGVGGFTQLDIAFPAAACARKGGAA